MIVVSDTSPILNLAAIGRLNLLHELFGLVMVPEAVSRELMAGGADRPGAVDVNGLDWVEARSCSNRPLVASLFLDLDEGEAEAIALAYEMGSDLLLIDERRGRMVAQRLGLTSLGLLGVLIKAKRDGLIPFVKPLLQELIATAGFWVSAELYLRVLSEVSEE